MKFAREEAIKKMVMMRMMQRFSDHSAMHNLDDDDEAKPFSLNSEENTPLMNNLNHNDVDVRSIGLKWKAIAEERAKRLETSDKSSDSDSESNEGEGGEGLSKSKILLTSLVLMGLGTLSVSVFSGLSFTTIIMIIHQVLMMIVAILC